MLGPVSPPIPWLGHAIEVASVLLFGWVWWELKRARAGGHHELVIAVLYGWLLETLDMWFFGTYHYGAMTWWWVHRVPIYIPLLWATIIHSSMALSDRSGLPGWARPLLDGLLAVLIDLAIDGIAIRAGLWSWTIPLNEGWFGVPAGNLCAWMFVAAWYGAAVRFIRRRIARGEPGWHLLFVPLLAYTGLFISIVLVGMTGHLLGLEAQNQRLWLFGAQMLLFVLAVAFAARQSRRQPSDGRVSVSLTANRWLMHGSFFLILFLTGVWRAVPWLVVVSFGSLIIEWQAQHWTERAW